MTVWPTSVRGRRSWRQGRCGLAVQRNVRRSTPKMPSKTRNTTFSPLCLGWVGFLCNLWKKCSISFSPFQTKSMSQNFHCQCLSQSTLVYHWLQQHRSEIYIYITFTFCVNNYSLLLMKWMNYSRKRLCHWCNDHILEKKPPTCKVVGLFQMNLRAGLKLSMQTRTALLSETAPWRL